MTSFIYTLLYIFNTRLVHTLEMLSAINDIGEE